MYLLNDLGEAQAVEVGKTERSLMFVQILVDGLGAFSCNQLRCFRNGVVEVGFSGYTQEIVEILAQLGGYLVH